MKTCKFNKTISSAVGKFIYHKVIRSGRMNGQTRPEQYLQGYWHGITTMAM